MRLINVNTFKLEEFFGQEKPPYAILSHAWGDQEVTFQEWERRKDHAVRCKDGYSKIEGACYRARADGLSYLWCDTNCIDKRNSAELTEAINSMYTWYYNSHVCYAYLADVEAKTGTFPNSRWFTRGWTLQELLAPSKFVFFDHRWAVLGDRQELASTISDITRIHIGALKNRETIRGYSIAQRMSWAADRQTGREEDIAYCLIGIFNINMPLLYGEGSKAFARLQREIIKVSDDQSILAWDLRHPDTASLTTALAPSPAEFRLCGSIVRNHEARQSASSITNIGIFMNLALMETHVLGVALVGLNCAEELYRFAPHSSLQARAKLPRHFRVWIALYRLDHHTYVRAHHPSSKIFLEGSYPILGHPEPTNLFLGMDASQLQATRLFENPAKKLRQDLPCLPSGVLIKVASGKIAPFDHTLREAYPLGDFSIVQLKPRGTSTVSSQLISSGSLSIICSVYWDEDGSPQQWLHTTIVDPKLKVSSQMASQEEWDCLFGGHSHSGSIQGCNSIAYMHSFHRKLQGIYGTSLNWYVKAEKDPVVIVEEQPLKDLFGRSVLIVDVIFREPPQSIQT
ncbi:HET-domain-containing protein [Hypoxylon fuscum]|nr:HET-domain-containing protein [Hypoxylon fuscum]